MDDEYNPKPNSSLDPAGGNNVPSGTLLSSSV